MNEQFKYNDAEIEVSISIKEDTIWLSQTQISKLFETSAENLSQHLKNFYKEKELDESSIAKDFSIVHKEGKYYSLDTVVSVRYRMNSYKATRFRQWVKEYMTQGYVVNTHKVTEYRFTNPENDMQFVKSKIKNDELQIKKGIFYDGYIFDAYDKVNFVIKQNYMKNIFYKNEKFLDVGINEVFEFIKTHQPIKANIIADNFPDVTQRTIKNYIKQLKNKAKMEFKGSPKWRICS